MTKDEIFEFKLNQRKQLFNKNRRTESIQQKTLGDMDFNSGLGRRKNSTTLLVKTRNFENPIKLEKSVSQIAAVFEMNQAYVDEIFGNTVHPNYMTQLEIK